MATTRQARRDDAGAVTGVVHAAYDHYVARIGQQPAPMGADYVALIEAGSVWVAEVAGQIVGVLVLQAYPDHLLIENVAVSPDAQGGGIGTCLIELAEREAVAAGLGEIRLYTNEAMTENLAYYPRRGFVETHRATEHGFSRVFFRKPVP
jgi:N-acetylglutamate synthase-like GNAT family acetyltransferase